MTGFRDAWKRYKQKIKERFFDKNSTIEDMLAKRPSDIAEDEFRQLIEYWKDPTVQVKLKYYISIVQLILDYIDSIFVLFINSNISFYIIIGHV